MKEKAYLNPDVEMMPRWVWNLIVVIMWFFVMIITIGAAFLIRLSYNLIAYQIFHK